MTHIAAPILDAIDGLRNVDTRFIDDDDNYDTVHIELQAVGRVGVRDGKPLLVFLHDVSWPTAWCEMYHAPERIPAAFCHPHDSVPARYSTTSILCQGKAFAAKSNWAMATDEAARTAAC